MFTYVRKNNQGTYGKEDQEWEGRLNVNSVEREYLQSPILQHGNLLIANLRECNPI